MDPYLFVKMHGYNDIDKSNKSKNRYDEALDEAIEEFINHRMETEDLATLHFTSPEAYRLHLKNEIRDSIECEEFRDYMKKAVNILLTEGEQYLTHEDYISLESELDKVYQRLQTLDIKEFQEEQLQKALILPAQQKSFILKIAISKFDMGLFPESISLFAFLTAIDPENPDYWYRLGLVAQESEQFDLAIRAYEANSQLVPDFIGSRIFVAECLFLQDEQEKALIELDMIKNKLKDIHDSEWEELVNQLEIMLTTPKSMNEIDL